MVEEDFGYSVNLDTAAAEQFVKNLQETRKSSRRYTAFYFLETVTVPYVAYNCSGIFPEPWESTMFGGLLLAEILAVGACFYSAYKWKKASSHLSELEQKVF